MLKENQQRPSSKVKTTTHSLSETAPVTAVRKVDNTFQASSAIAYAAMQIGVAVEACLCLSPASYPKSFTPFAGATPISHFLGAIVSGSQGALTSSAREMNLQVGHVKWHATGKYDVRGVRGEEVCLRALMHASDYACTVHESKHELFKVSDCCYRLCVHIAMLICMMLKQPRSAAVQPWAGFCLAPFAYLLPDSTHYGSSGCWLRLFSIAGISITAQEH